MIRTRAELDAERDRRVMEISANDEAYEECPRCYKEGFDAAVKLMLEREACL